MLLFLQDNFFCLNWPGIIYYLEYFFCSLNMRDVSDRLQAHIESKQYLHATDLLVTSVTLLHNDLANVEALRDIRGELDHKKEVVMVFG